MVITSVLGGEGGWIISSRELSGELSMTIASLISRQVQTGWFAMIFRLFVGFSWVFWGGFAGSLGGFNASILFLIWGGFNASIRFLIFFTSSFEISIWWGGSPSNKGWIQAVLGWGGGFPRPIWGRLRRRSALEAVFHVEACKGVIRRALVLGDGSTWFWKAGLATSSGGAI